MRSGVTVNEFRFRAQLNKLDIELINNGLFSGKIYFQHDNAKPHDAQIVKEKNFSTMNKYYKWAKKKNLEENPKIKYEFNPQTLLKYLRKITGLEVIGD